MVSVSWQPETDLKGLKRRASLLLDIDIKPTKFSPLVVSHPFTDSGIVGIRGKGGRIKVANLEDDLGAVGEWREQVRQQINESQTAFRLFVMVTKPYRLGFLEYAIPFLSEQDAAQLLSWTWTSSEAPNSNPNLSKAKALKLFRSIDPAKLMDEEEYERFQSLGNVVTVYRGVTSYNAKNVKALSWTLDRDVAEWFAHRYGEQGTVYEAQIQKEHIHALFLGRNESEVIVDPKHLISLSALEVVMDTEEKQVPNMTMGGI